MSYPSSRRHSCEAANRSTFNNELGRARDLLPSVLSYTGVFTGVRQLDVNDVQLPIFAVRGELVLGALAQITTIFHP